MFISVDNSLKIIIFAVWLRLLPENSKKKKKKKKKNHDLIMYLLSISILNIISQLNT